MQTEKKKIEKQKPQNKKILRKNRRLNITKKTIKRTMSNKIIKEQFKKSRRKFLNADKLNILQTYKIHESYIGKMYQKNIINRKKASRLQSNLRNKYNILSQ